MLFVVYKKTNLHILPMMIESVYVKYVWIPINTDGNKKRKNCTLGKVQ